MDSETAAHMLRQDGFALWDDFLPAEIVAGMRMDGEARLAKGELHAASIGRAGQRQYRPDVRGDFTTWLAADEACWQPYFNAMEQLRTSFNRTLFLGLASLEAQLACFPEGRGYARHRDRFHDHDARVVSSVLYLNQAWRAEHGGCLRAFHAESARDYLPIGGRLLLFLSDELEHEVLPACRPRWSIAGWFRRH